jgi:L-cysteine desulfidase
MAKTKMKVEALASDPNVVSINGKRFILDRVTTKKIDKIEHSDKILFKELDEDTFKKDKDLIVKTLAEKTTSTELINEIMKDVPASVIRRVAKRIRKKKPIKKQHGCLGFKIGDAYLQLVG